MDVNGLTMPGVSPGTSMPVVDPNPKSRYAWYISSSPSRCARVTAPMFDDFPRISVVEYAVSLWLK